MITLKRILVPHDFSETSEAAMKYATELARIFGAKLDVLHVSKTDRSDTPTGFALSFELRRGTPSTEIVRYARERDIDLIVMGTHGRGLLAHAVMGSVTEKVVRNAPCPVLTLPWWSFALAVESPRPSEVISAPIQVLACA